jgi:hypothetical protein
LEYDSKPLGFDNLVKDLYATYSITLTENEYNDILAVYKNRHIDWLDSFYLKKTTKRLTPERLAYIRKKYLGLDIQLVENELLKKEIDLRLRKISSLTIKKKEVEKNIYNKFNVKAYSIITIIIWTLIILPIAFLVSSFLKKKKTQQPT